MDDQLEYYAELVAREGAERAGHGLWDLVVITAISERQRACYEAQVARKLACKRLPRCFEYLVVADPEGAKIGSGGSTLNVLRVLHERFGDRLYSLKVLLLHCGGYSQRVPFNTVLGKIFAPVPCRSAFVNDVLDMQLAIFTPLSLHMQPGIFLTSSDIVVTGRLEEQLRAGSEFGRDGNAFSLLAHRVSLSTGKDHGIYGIYGIAGEPADSHATTLGKYECQFVLQKPSVEKMRATPGVVQADAHTGQEYVICDSSFYFSHAVSRTLKQFQERHLDALVANGLELDAYRDFLQPLGSQPIGLDEFLASAKSEADVFREMYATFAGLRTAVIALTDSEFFHLGTIQEILELYLGDTQEASCFRRAICFTDSKPGGDGGGFSDKGCSPRRAGIYHSRLNENCKLSDKALAEFCSVGEGLSLELADWAYVNTCRLRACELRGGAATSFTVPGGTCMHTVAVRHAGGELSFVTVFFQRRDDLKKNYQSTRDLRWLGSTLPPALADRLTVTPASGCSVWSLRAFRARRTMTESFVSALAFCHSYLGDRMDEVEKQLDEELGEDGAGQLYSLFDILRLHSVESMIQFREDMMSESRH